MQDFDKQIQGVFKDNSKTKTKLLRTFKYQKQDTQEAQNTVKKRILGIAQVYIYDTVQCYVDISFAYFCIFFISENEVSSKQ